MGTPIIYNNPITYLEQNMDNHLVMVQFCQDKSDMYIVHSQFVGRYTIDQSNPDDQVIRIESTCPTYYPNGTAMNIGGGIHHTHGETLATDFVEIHYPTVSFVVGRNFLEYANGLDQPETETYTSYILHAQTIDILYVSDGSALGEENIDLGAHFFSYNEEIQMFISGFALELTSVSPTYFFQESI